MVGFASDVSARWVWGVALVWAVAAVGYMYRASLLRLPETSRSFPFSFKQFLLMGMGLCAAVGLYFGSFIVADGLLSALETSVTSMCPAYTAQEWPVLTQITALILAFAGLLLIRSFFPDDALSMVVGADRGIKKLFKGAAVGVLVLPIIFVTTWIVGVVASLLGAGPKAPQLSLELFLHISHSGAMFWGMVGVAIFLAPFVEEMIFRGFLQGFLNGLIHPALSVLVTAATFAAFHYSSLQMGSNVEIITGLFLFAIVASNLREREDSILASIGYHAAFNATSLALLFWWS